LGQQKDHKKAKNIEGKRADVYLTIRMRRGGAYIF
jgi:hypothetical protein